MTLWRPSRCAPLGRHYPCLQPILWLRAEHRVLADKIADALMAEEDDYGKAMESIEALEDLAKDGNRDAVAILDRILVRMDR